MNKILKCLILFSFVFLKTITLYSETNSIEKTLIEENVYNSSNYIRSPLFKEQDLIYNRQVVFQPGLELICLQDKVKVEIRGYETMYTPIDLNNVPAGDYIIKLYKTGYYPAEFRISISTGKRTSLKVTLAQYSALLVLKNLPDNAVVYINNHKVDGNKIEVPVGDNSLRISAFGFKDFTSVINIENVVEVVLDPKMEKRNFALSDLSLRRDVIWTDDSRSQKRISINIYTDAPGSGSLIMRKVSDDKVIEEVTLSFVESKTTYIFDLDDYKDMEPGDYKIIVEGVQEDFFDQAETVLTVKKGSKSTWRNNFTGFSGFIFSPTAETLPRGVTQLQTIICPVFSTGSINNIFVPSIMSLRTSIINNLELSLGAGLYISPEIDLTAIDIFLSAKYNFLTVDGGDGFSMTAGLSVNYNGKTSSYSSVPDYDPFAGLTGLSIIIPMEYKTGPLSFIISPEFKISPSYPGLDESEFSNGKVYLWNYFRTAIALDLGEFSTAISAAIQSPSYMNSTDKRWPFFIGLDVNSTPGNTGFSCSLFGGLRVVKICR
jgi:hypothetical protein